MKKPVTHVLLPLVVGALFSACSDTAVVPEQPEEIIAPQPKQKPETKAPEPVQVPSVKPVKKGSLTSIEMGALFAMSQTGKVLLIDVRPPLYYRLGHIDGAENFPLIKYDKVLVEKRPLLEGALKAGQVIVLYCQDENCPDAHKTGLKLIELGYSVSVYRGGWVEWKQAGL